MSNSRILMRHMSNSRKLLTETVLLRYGVLKKGYLVSVPRHSVLPSAADELIVTRIHLGSMGGAVCLC